jgi:hypothetical protein
MPRPRARFAAVLLLAGLVLGLVAPVATLGAQSYKLNLYSQGVFTTQYTWTWCVGASAQAMLNIIKDTENHSRSKQKQLVQYAMNHDEHAGNQGGSDAVGLAATLRHHGGGSYSPVFSTSYRQAVRRAVKAIRATGKPVGLLVMGGRHAWVLNGFEATADPAATNNFEVTHVYVMGPLYPKQQGHWFDRPPNSRISYDGFKTPFRRFDDPDSPRMVGYWVSVNP